MNTAITSIPAFVHNVYNTGIKPCCMVKDNSMFIHDPVFHINRNRVVAETLKTVLRLDIEDDPSSIEKMLRYLISTQHGDGSWSEIHAHYDKASALITSIVGEALLLAFQNNILKDEIGPLLIRAKDFVLRNERTQGNFLKSTSYTADHLNVDATCGAFLARYAAFFHDTLAYEAAVRASTHIIDHQSNTGVYPYTVDKGNYPYIQNVACLHYQGVTLYYLSKIHMVTKDEHLKKSLLKGAYWLANQQKQSGWFDWSHSGLLFAYYLTGAYGFAYASYKYMSQFDTTFIDHMNTCFNILELLTSENGLFHRWEKSSWRSLPRSMFDSVDTAKMVEVPFKQSLFRFAYAIYRQVARRRYAESIDETLFNIIISLCRLPVSTIEPFANYPDLFMTTEIMDCLSFCEIS